MTGPEGRSLGARPIPDRWWLWTGVGWGFWTRLYKATGSPLPHLPCQNPAGPEAMGSEAARWTFQGRTKIQSQTTEPTCGYSVHA